MTSSIERKEHRKFIVVGLIIGAAAVFFDTAWGTFSSAFVLWILLEKRKDELSLGDVLRFAAGWLLAVMICNILMQPAAFLAGFVDGWNAGPK
jgi:hypothetical protein